MDIQLKNATITQHISHGDIRTEVTADAYETLKCIGAAASLYFPICEEHGYRVIPKERDGKAVIVLEKDVSYHGTPAWEEQSVLVKNPEHVEDCLQFSKLLQRLKLQLNKAKG